MKDSDAEDSEAVFAVLSDTQDLARSNLVKAFLNAFGGYMVLALVVLADHGLFNSFEFAQFKSSYEVLWAAKWIVAIGSCLYVFMSLGHAYVSWRHICEARYLWRRLDHV